MSYYQCIVPVAGIYSAPKPSSALDDQLLYGQGFEVESITRGWAHGQAVPFEPGAPGYIGYVRTKELSENISVPNNKISCLQAPLFFKPDFKSAIVSFLPREARVVTGEEDGDFFATPDGWIHKQHLFALNEYALDFVAVAESYLGLPYVWGGKSGDGLDCSGLVQMAMWATGRDCPRDASQQEEFLGVDVGLGGGLTRGDMVFWKGHVGIMVDDAHLLHANAFHMRTALEPITEALRRIDDVAGPVRAMKKLEDYIPRKRYM